MRSLPPIEGAAAFDPDLFIPAAAARTRFALTVGLLAGALLLGGASAAGWIANAVLQWLAIGTLAWLVIVERSAILPNAAGARWWLGLAAAAILLSLVPLPPAVWSNLPGRGVIVEGFRAARMPLPWQPITMAPDATIRSALSLLVPLATFLLVTRLPIRYREYSVYVIVAAACLGLVLGFVQLSGGEDSTLRFYAVTTPHRAVGQFANPNHLATLLVVAIPLLAVIGRAPRGAEVRSPWLQRRALVAMALAGMLALGVVAAGSVAGYGLALLAILGLGLVATVRLLRGGHLLGLAILLVSVAFLLVTAIMLTGMVEVDTFSRVEAARDSSRIAWQLLPVGGGLGAFPELYRIASDPLLVTKVFLNHVHNDYVEVVLEMGVAGIVLIALAIGWFVTRMVRVWTREQNQGVDVVARAATFVILLVLMHSLVDYPLRTAALAAVFGWACGCLTDPPEIMRRRTAVLPADRGRQIDADMMAFVGGKVKA